MEKEKPAWAFCGVVAVDPVASKPRSAWRRPPTSIDNSLIACDLFQTNGPAERTGTTDIFV
jgi:hypothetical protein